MQFATQLLNLFFRCHILDIVRYKDSENERENGGKLKNNEILWLIGKVSLDCPEIQFATPRNLF